MSLLLLDLDVIEIILSYMSTQDRWQLCTICRAAHAAILPRLLSKVDIGLSDSTERRMNQIAQFCRFMLADVPHRIPHLMSLTLGPAFAPPYVAAPLRPIYDHYWFAVSLGHVVALATGLLKISIPQAYWAFEHVPRLLYALISLPDLDHVELYDVNVLHLPLLSKMKSRPRHLAFEERDARFHAVQLLPHGLEFHGRRQLFSELAGSLNILETSLSSESVNELDVVMPLVHTLKISGRIESLAPYSRTFPGVRTLYVHASLGDSLVVTNSTWPQLDFVRTHSPLQLWHCPIRRLELVYFYHNPRGDTLRSATRTMLPKTSSVVLTMLSDYGLFKSLPPDALRCLQFLQLCVSESALIATSLQDEIVCDLDVMNQNRYS